MSALRIIEDADVAAALNAEVRSLDARLDSHESAAADTAATRARLVSHRAALTHLEDELVDAQEKAGSLAAGLAALRENLSDDMCPVCGRDFRELSSGRLTNHLDEKIAALTGQGLRIQAVRTEQKSVGSDLQRDERMLVELSGRLLQANELEAAIAGRAATLALLSRYEILLPSIEAGAARRADLLQAERDIADLEAAAREGQLVRAELDTVQEILGSQPPDADESVNEAWYRLDASAAAEVVRMTEMGSHRHRR